MDPKAFFGWLQRCPGGIVGVVWVCPRSVPPPAVYLVSHLLWQFPVSHLLATIAAAQPTPTHGLAHGPVSSVVWGPTSLAGWCSKDSVVSAGHMSPQAAQRKSLCCGYKAEPWAG